MFYPHDIVLCLSAKVGMHTNDSWVRCVSTYGSLKRKLWGLLGRMATTTTAADVWTMRYNEELAPFGVEFKNLTQILVRFLPRNGCNYYQTGDGRVLKHDLMNRKWVDVTGEKDWKAIIARGSFLNF